MHHQTTRTRRCAGPSCRNPINARWLMCRACWPIVPSGLRREITQSHRPGRRHQSIRYHAAVRQAIDHLASDRRQAS